MEPNELHDLTDTIWKASGLELECNRESAIAAKIALTKGVRAAWAESWTTTLRALFVQEKRPTMAEPMLMSYNVKPTTSPVRQMLGRIQLNIRDVERAENEVDRAALLACLAQDIHDALRSFDLAPMARAWVEEMQRTFFPKNVEKPSDVEDFMTRV